MLEKMAEFFENRLDGYEEHMLNNIESAKEFYPFTAEQLPGKAGAKVLDLGCGTGLELEYYFKLNDSAFVTGVDLSKGMIAALARKFPDAWLHLIVGSYFDVDFGEVFFDGVVSVESLHHFTMEEKIPLYRRLHKALKADGYFILTDYFSLSDEEEKEHRRELEKLRKENNITDNEFYHFDTPLTVEHEIEALECAGFLKVEVLKNWGATYILKAWK